MDEECDFESLAALLEDDDMQELSSPQQNAVLCASNAVPATKDPTTLDAQSSDDDIDEDELDRLATLADESEATLHVKSVAVEKSAARQRGVASQAVGMEAHQSRGESALSVGQEHDAECEKSSSAARSRDGNVGESRHSGSGNDSDSDDDADLKKQLLHMQQQMAVMAAKLEQKKKNKKKASSPKTSRPSTVTVSAGNSSKEFNIFDIIDQEKKEKRSGQGHTVPAASDDGGSAEAGNGAPWERKRGVPMTGYKLSAGRHKQPASASNAQLDTKLSSVVEKITEKRKEKGQEISATKSTSFYGSKDSLEGLEQTLFGSDSDSDWSDLEGQKESNLSKEGKELAKSLKKRVAHHAKYDASDLEKYREKPKSSRSWNASVYGDAAKNGLATQNGKPRAADSEENDATRDPFSGIRIFKPLVSSVDMRRRMDGRRMIKMSHISSKRNTSAVEGDWVTIGVVVHKGEPRMSQNNKQYSVWKLSDLEDCDQVVHLFLFGETHKAHWKTIQGSVIGLLNPTIMKSAEKYAAKDGNSVSITLDDKNKLMLMGTSKDLGVCRAKTKSGKPCTNHTNKHKHEYCTYHVQAQYKKMSAKRGELSSGFSGVTPKAAEKKLFTNKNSIVTYGGKTYTSASVGGSGVKKKKDQVKVAHLQSHFLREGGASKVSTLALHNLVPEDKQKLRDYQAKLAEKEKAQVEKNKAFHDMLSVPTVGSMNFVKHLVTKEQIQVERKTKAPVRSVSAKELLEMAGDAHKKRTASSRPAVSGEVAASPSREPGAPSLGRGLAPGMDVEFDMEAPIPRPPKEHLKKQIAKKKAIAKVIAEGGVKKANPNAVKKSHAEVKAKVKKRLARAAFGDEECESGGSNEPARKRSRLLGDIDLNDPEVQKLLKQKSRHAEALTEEEQERQEAYFQVLEKKEAMEEQMAQVTKQKCTAVICHQCKYKALSAAERCKTEHHKLTYDKNAVKRWFKCNGCGTKVASLDKYPCEACRNCGSSSYLRSSMLYERKGPKLPSEELLLRGEERKFVNS